VLWYWRPPCLLRTVSVSLIAPGDTSIRGVLWESRGPWLTVRQAVALKEGCTPESLAGDVVIERTNIAFIQVLI
jgi:hypothetical protein